MSVSAADLAQLAPMWVLLATGVLLLMYEVFATQADRTYCANIAVVGFAFALYAFYRQLGADPAYLFGQPGSAPVVLDGFARASSMLLIAGGLVASLLSPAYARNAHHDHGEYYALIVFSVVGMIIMVLAGDLITFFLGLETMSIAVYALTGLRSGDIRSVEAALKYFLMGAFATGFLLFGIALVYGAVGAVGYGELHRFLHAGAGPLEVLEVQPILTMGLVLIIIGFAFKVAAVPFHMWAPDVYEGAPTPVAGFMAVGVKAAAFLALLRAPDADLRYAALFDMAPVFGAQVPLALRPEVKEELQAAVATEAAVQVQPVREATEVVYDAYLKANAVEEGIGDYDAVARLVQRWLAARPDDRQRLERLAGR